MRPALEPEGAAGTGTSASPRVLFIEDDEDIRLCMSLSLQEAGYDVIEAEDGREALGRPAVERGEVDLVVLDLTLPDRSGASFLPVLRRSLRAGTPIVVYSGRSDLEDETIREGASAFVVKSGDPDLLIAAIRSALEARSAPRRSEGA